MVAPKPAVGTRGEQRRQRPLGRLSLIAQTSVPVRQLPGFDRRFHQVPKQASQSACGFVAAIGATVRRERLQAVRARVREHFGYRRRQLVLGDDHLSAPDFEYFLEHQLDPEDPSTVHLRVEISEFRSPAVLSMPAFYAAFCGPGEGQHRFDRVRVEHRVPVDVEACIDSLEDRGVKVVYPDDCVYMELPGSDPLARLRVEPCAVELRGAPGETPAALFENLLSSVTELAELGIEVLPRAA